MISAGQCPLPYARVISERFGHRLAVGIAMAGVGAGTALKPQLARGTPVPVAASILAIVGFATITRRLVSGYLLDRIFALYIPAGFCLLPPGGLILLIVGASGPTFAAAVTCFGLSLGAEVDMIGYLLGRYFGLLRYGKIYGYMSAIFTIGSGLGPYIMGAAFDMTHSYTVGLVVFGFALIIASFFSSRLRPYTEAGPSCLSTSHSARRPPDELALVGPSSSRLFLG